MVILILLFKVALSGDKEDFMELLKLKSPEKPSQTDIELKEDVAVKSKENEEEKKKDTTQHDDSPESLSDSILISKKMRGVITVALKAEAVRNFEKSSPVEKTSIPVFLACKALNLPEKQIMRIVNAHDAFRIQQMKASERDLTRKWGKANIYYVQINTDYLVS